MFSLLNIKSDSCLDFENKSNEIEFRLQQNVCFVFNVFPLYFNSKTQKNLRIKVLVTGCTTYDVLKQYVMNIITQMNIFNGICNVA